MRAFERLVRARAAADFNFLTFADAFAIFLGLSTMLTILGARLLLGASERLGWGEARRSSRCHPSRSPAVPGSGGGLSPPPIA